MRATDEASGCSNRGPKDPQSAGRNANASAATRRAVSSDAGAGEVAKVGEAAAAAQATTSAAESASAMGMSDRPSDTARKPSRSIKPASVGRVNGEEARSYHARGSGGGDAKAQDGAREATRANTADAAGDSGMATQPPRRQSAFRSDVSAAVAAAARAGEPSAGCGRAAGAARWAEDAAARPIRSP